MNQTTKRPKGLGRNPFTGTPVKNRSDMEVYDRTPEEGVIYLDKVEDAHFYYGGKDVGRVDL